MAGLYETMLGYLNTPTKYTPPKTATVFGNAATTPAIVDVGNAKINYLTEMVQNAKNALATEQSNYDRAMQAYNSQLNTRPIASIGGENAIYRGSNNHLYNNYAKANTKAIAPDASGVNTAQTALTKAKNDLAKAVANQKLQKLAGQDAVKWGLAAKNAEQQSIANAAQMYQQAMQGETIRNAIMNNAIGTVGGFGGGQ